MCGICGLVTKYPVNDEVISGVSRMNLALYHRGPDSEGFYNDSNIVMAMRRLKIIDLEGGNQPLFNEEASLVLIANGEIYNHIALRENLKKKGHIFKTLSDCEVILHLFEEEGEACVNRLRGMFSFAIYDMRKKKLFIARDRLSEKPLYYYHSGDEFVFSSELKSLLTYIPLSKLNISPESINLYFHYQFVPEPLTCLKEIKKLPAAHYINISLEDFSLSLKKYWHIENAQPVYGKPAELIRDTFDELSRLIIRADVPVGISLSGGIDSSAIACYAAKYYGTEMHAFSVGYPGRPKNDERSMAEKLAHKLGLGFHDVELRTDDLVSSFPDLVSYMDDPIADIAAFGYYSVHKAAKEQGIPVLLNGFGGDELFWGYEPVRIAAIKSLKKRQIMTGAQTEGLFHDALSAAMGKIKIKELLLQPATTINRAFSSFKYEKEKFLENPERFVFYDEMPDFMPAFDYLPALYTDTFKAKVDEEMPYSFFTNSDWNNIPIKICQFLFQTWLYSNCIALGDRMSMANSVESRLPLLDYKLVELVMGLRKANMDDYNLGHKKWLKDAMEGIVPSEVLNRPKSGFSPPCGEWFRAIIKKYGDFCLDGYLVEKGVFKGDQVRLFIKKALAGRGDLFFAYKIVILEMWFRRVLYGNNTV